MRLDALQTLLAQRVFLACGQHDTQRPVKLVARESATLGAEISLLVRNFVVRLRR